MRAAALLFRFRLWVLVLLHVVGFLPPWARLFGGGTLWLAASTLVARSGWMSLANATVTVTCAALACLVAGTVWRLWGTAYLGAGIMRDPEMHATQGKDGQQLVSAGPYCYLRNPLYLGGWLMALGVSILMPLSGAAFFVPAYSVVMLLLIFAEERFLAARLGAAYTRYRLRIPRLWPAFAGGEIASAARPEWLQAVLAESYCLTFTCCFAVLAWRYNAHLLIQCLMVCFGVSLVVHALTARPLTARSTN